MGTHVVDRSAWRNRYYDVAGICAHSIEAGTGETLVLVHGALAWCCAGLTSGAVLGPLSRTMRVVAVDLPGYGTTETRGARVWTAAEPGALLIAWLRQLGAVLAHPDAEPARVRRALDELAALVAAMAGEDANVNWETLRLLADELWNFTDGRRTIADVADAIGFEFGLRIRPDHLAALARGLERVGALTLEATSSQGTL